MIPRRQTLSGCGRESVQWILPLQQTTGLGVCTVPTNTVPANLAQQQCSLAEIKKKGQIEREEKEGKAIQNLGARVGRTRNPSNTAIGTYQKVFAHQFHANDRVLSRGK